MSLFLMFAIAVASHHFGAIHPFDGGGPGGRAITTNATPTPAPTIRPLCDGGGPGGTCK